MDESENKINRDERRLILAIDPNGGCSVFADSREIAARRASPGISPRAENLLENVLDLQRVAKLRGNRVAAVVISGAAPASTGEKILAASAAGLAKAFGCRLLKISLLQAMLDGLKNEPDGDYCAALAAGRDRVCWQCFRKKGQQFEPIQSEATISNLSDFLQQLKVLRANGAIVESKLFERIELRQTIWITFVENQQNHTDLLLKGLNK